MAGKSSRLAILLDLDGSEFEKGLNRSLSRFKSASKRMESAGRGLSMGLTAPLALVGATSFKVATDFELAMAKVGAVSGGGEAGLRKLTEQAKNLGATTSFSASDVSSLQLELSKLGFGVGELTGQNGLPGMTNSVLNLSKAFDSDLGETAEVVGATLRQFSKNAEDTGAVTDVMAKAFGASALDLTKFSESMKNAGPVANTFGFSLEETTALLGVMANNGISGADAGTKLKMALSELAKSGVPVKDTFQKLLAGGVSYTEAMDTLGTRAAILGPIFGKNLKDLSDLQKELDGASGTAQQMSDVMGNTTAGKMAEMNSAIEAMQIELGTALAPTVLEVANVIRELASSFANLDKDTKETIVKIGMAVASLGPMLIVGGKVTGAIGKLSGAFKLLSKASVSGAGKSASALGRLIPLLMNPAFLAGAGAFVAIGVALKPLVERMTSFSYQTRTAQGATEELNKRLGEESAEARVLFGELKNAVAMERDRGKAIEELQKKYPDYLGNLDLNKASLEDIAKLETQVTDAIGDRIRQQLLAEAQQKKLEAQTKVERGIISAENVLLGAEFDPAVIKRTSALVRQFFGEIADGTREVGKFDAIGPRLKKFLTDSGAGANLSQRDFNRLANSFMTANVEGEGLVGDFDFMSTSLIQLAGEVSDTGASLRRYEEMVARLSESTNEASEGTKSDTDAQSENADATDANTDATKSNTDAKKQNKDATAEANDATQKQTETLGQLFTRLEETQVQTEQTVSPLQLMSKRLREIGTLQGIGMIDSVEALRQRLEATEEAFQAMSLADEDFIGTPMFQKMKDEIDVLREALGGAEEGLQQVGETAKESFDFLQAGADASSQVAGALFDSLIDKEKKFGEAVKNIAVQMVRTALTTAVANAITSAFSPASPDNIATGGASAPAKAVANVSAVQALFASFTAFAQGGAVLGPTLALIGENPASRGEFVVPFERMGQFMEMAGAGQSPEFSARVLGDDLLLSSKRSERKLSRTAII